MLEQNILSNLGETDKQALEKEKLPFDRAELFFSVSD
jgi:hypothetical protein